MLHRFKTIAVGIEPFGEPSNHFVNTLQTMSWFSADNVKTFFIGVLNPEDTGWPREFNDDDEWLSEIQNQAFSQIQSALDKAKFVGTFEVKILIQKTSSKTATVETFANFIEKNEVDLVIVHSHTKSILKSALGSFCSRLIHRSKIPIMVAPFDRVVSHHLRSILFPTDFSGLSKRVFHSIVAWSGKLNAAVILYHRVSRPIDEVLQVAFHPARSRAVLPSDIVVIAENGAKRKASHWLEANRENNSSLTFEINSDGATLTSAITNQSQKKKVDLIALPTHSSYVNVLSFGSTVSHVLRSSHIPVLIIPVTYIPPGEFAE